MRKIQTPKVLTWLRNKLRPKKIKATAGPLSKNSPLRELFSSDTDLKLLMELSQSDNTFAGVSYDKFTVLPFAKVHQVIAHVEVGELIEAIEVLTDKKINVFLEEDSGSFIKFVKWITEQIKIINFLYEKLSKDSTEDFDEDDIAYQNAGSDRLNKYKEIMVYYAIDKNPANWEGIGKTPFEKVFTKLLIDKDLGIVNKKYIKIISSRK